MEKELELFLEVVDGVIDYVMERDVKDAAIREIQKKVQTEVYDKYPNPVQYERKMWRRGLLDSAEAPDGSMEVHYDSKIKLLTVEDVRKDWEPTHKPEGRNVAEVVETGEGYDYKDIGPRPFHAKAEEALIRTKEVDKILTKAMKENLGAWSL